MTVKQRQCDHTSVGMIVLKKNKILLIERKKRPYGFAPPAGHVDSHRHYKIAAIKELKEEVGLKSKNIKLIAEGKKNNPCRRRDGTWHYWKIYQVVAVGEIVSNNSEVKKAGWYTATEIQTLMKKTEAYKNKQISPMQWKRKPGVEPVWYQWFKELKILKMLTDKNR